MEKKKKDLAENPTIEVQKPQQEDYTPDPNQVKKDLYNRDKDQFFADERLYRLDSVKQRDALGKFFDNISVPYYKGMGLSDENTIKELRNKFIESNISKLSLAKKKEEEAPVPEVDYPDFVEPSQTYSRFYSQQDVISPKISDADLYKTEDAYKAQRYEDERVAAAVPQILELPDFGYIKTNPEEYLKLQNIGEEKKVRKMLKGLDFNQDQRNQILAGLNFAAEREFINNERRKWEPGKLNEESAKAAVPYVDGATPGTFLDPATGMRKVKAETEAEADQLALIDKYQKEILNSIISSSPTNPLAGQKQKLEEAQAQLVEKYQEVDELRKAAENSLKGELIATSPEVDAWKKAQSDLIKQQADLDKQIKDFNDQVEKDNNLAGSVNRDITDKERLQQIVNDSYLMMKFWDDEYARLNKAYKEKFTPYSTEEEASRSVGFRPMPITPAMEETNRRRYDATAKFEAASRMLYNNEGPLDIEKDAKFMAEVFGDAFMKALTKQETPVGDKKTEQLILQKMAEIGMRDGVELTDEELDQIQPGFIEHAMAIGGSLSADLPALMVIGSATSAIKMAPMISRLTKGYKVIRNPVLEKEGAKIAKEVITKEGRIGVAEKITRPKSFKKFIAFDDPVPTGWEVIREAKPTTVSKLKGFLMSSLIDEAAFTGAMGMTPGFMTGINASHTFLPDVKLKGKWGAILQPFVDMFYKSAVGATVGMEAGAAASGMVNALMTDSTVKDEMEKLYPNLDEATKRVLAEVVINGIFFGGMGAVTTASQKAMTAPLGAKFGKGGGRSWMAYFDPKLRGRVFEAAKTADEKGYTDTAKELYRWLDMTKEPITGKEIKQQRLDETEAMAKIMPVGVLRMAVDANRQAIKVLEGLNNDPKFDGFVTLQTRSAKDIKPMDTVEMDGKYYEVTQVRSDKNGKPIEFLLMDIETGEPTRAFTDDVRTDIHYKIGSRLELALRLENHYERLQVFNEVLADKGYYGKEFKALKTGPPAPKALGKSTGIIFAEVPKESKIEQRKAQLEREQAEMNDMGLEPIELPDQLRKEYRYGEPGKIMDLPAGKFAETLAGAEDQINKYFEETDQKIADINEQLKDDRFKGRITDKAIREEKQGLRDEIMRLEHSKEVLQTKMMDELRTFWEDAYPQMEERAFGKADFEAEDIKEIEKLVWAKIKSPTKDMADKTIGEIFDETIDEYMGKEDQKPAEPMERMREIEAMAKAEGYTFTVNADADPDRTVVDVADPEGRVIDWDELPKGIREMAEEFTELMHQEGIATGYTPEAKPEPKAEPQFPEGFNTTIESKTDKMGVEKQKYILWGDDGKTKISQLTFDIEERDGERFLSAPQIVTTEGNEGKGYATELYKYALQNLPEGISGIYSIASEIHDKGAVGAIHNKLAQFYDVQTLENGDKIIRPKKEPLQTKEETDQISRNNRLVGMVEEYNNTPANQKKKLSELLQQIARMADEFGYKIQQKGQKINVLNQEGKKIRRQAIKEEYETIESLKDSGMKEFVSFMVKAKDYLNGIAAPSMGPVGLQKATSILASGKATQQSQYLMEALKGMYKSGYLKFVIDGEVIYEPIKDYVDLIKNQKFEQYIQNYGGLTLETIAGLADLGLFPKEEIDLYKQAITEEYEERLRYEREWEAEQKRIDDERGGGGPPLPETKGKGETPQKPPAKPGGSKVDIGKDLKDMTDLLKLLGDENAMFAGDTGGPDENKIKIQLNTIASGMIRKFTEAGITDFDQILAQVITQVDPPVMKKLLPFLKQGYGAISMDAPEDVMEKMAKQFQRVRMYGEKDLEKILAEKNKPAETTDDFSDVLNKEFYIKKLGKTVKVARVMEWDEVEYNRMVRQYDGLFTKDEKLPMLVVAFEGDPVTYAKLEQLRKGIQTGEITEKQPYNDPARAAAFERIAKEFEAIGGIEEAEYIRKKALKPPIRGVSVEDEIKGLENYRKQTLLELQIRYGEIWFEKKPFTPLTFDTIYALLDDIKDAEPLEPYIKANVPEEKMAEVLSIENQIGAWRSVIGMTAEDIQNINALFPWFAGISPRSTLRFIGDEGRRLANGDKRTKPEQIQRRLKQLDDEIAQAKKKITQLKKNIFTWRMTYLLNKGEPIRDAKQLKFIASQQFGIGDLTTIREQTELALTILARRLAQNRNLTLRERYDRILALYNTFPLQDAFATSTVKTLQQFSTPVPIAYLMGVYTNSDVVNSVLDPTAGNGALVIFADKKAVRVNELDENRFMNLLSQGYRVAKSDATKGIANLFDRHIFDAINTNPPFSVDVSGEFSGVGPHPYKLEGTYFMVAKALEALADHGKASIIIGKHTEFDPDGMIKGASELKFFHWLNSNYYVEDVINLDGEMYRRMGTSYPVRLILVNGRKAVPEGKAPMRTEKDAVVSGWGELYDRVIKLRTDPHEKAILRPGVDAVGRDATVIRSKDSTKPTDKEDIGPDADPSRPLSDPAGERPPEGETTPTGTLPKRTSGEQPDRTGGPDTPVPGNVGPLRGLEDPIKRTPKDRGEIQPGAGGGNLPGKQSGIPVERTGRVIGMINRETDQVIPYLPLSRLSSGNEMVPGAMSQQLEDALMQLKDEVGDIDDYVMTKLKYNSLEAMSQAFYGTQVDGIGMAIFNIENGDAMIIGDQTGVGKGRIAAGIISYAVENGYIPVFITKSANLFTDIYRDLFDIGKPNYKPFIVNKEADKGIARIYQPNTEEVLYTWDRAKYNQMVAKGELPEGVDIVLATYSQFASEKGSFAKRREFLLNIAPRAIFIMDESHEASGDSNTGKFFKEFIERAAGGLYLSATFAKRPDNLPVYAMKTVLKEANMSYEELVEAISNGGPALQEIISSQLAESIQFTRRQLNMDNIERNWYVLGDDEKGSFFYNPELGEQLKKDYDNIAYLMHDIIEFQKVHIRPLIEAINLKLRKEGEKAGERKGTSEMGAYNHPYFSKVFNIVNQLLLAIKVKHALPVIIDELRAGRKPFITLSNTMEAMLDDLNLDYGETMETDFKEVLKRGVKGVMRYTVTTMSGVKEEHVIDLTDLSRSGSAAYQRLMERIRSISTNITITPIDVLIKGITDAGFTPLEITGRSSRFELTDDYMHGKYVPNKRPNKNTMINLFNNKPGYAIIANVSGSTGLSAHSSAKFMDTSQRVGINLQPDLDVNVVVQMDGRINRADQINKPMYIHIISVLPAEKRIAMMNAKKLKSLYANTTSNQKSSTSITEATDFLNKYGDRIVAEWLQENPDVNDMMNNPVDLSKEDVSGAAHKVTGKIAVLPIEVQERFYTEVSERYEAEIEYLNQTGQNDLEVKSEKLNAVTLSKETVIHGKGGSSVFGDDTNLETVEVDVLRKPLTKKELDDLLATVMEGITSEEEYANNMVREMSEGVDAIYGKRIAALQEKHEANLDAKRKEAETKEGRAEDVKAWLEEQILEMEEKHIRMLEIYEEGAKYQKMNHEKIMRFFYPGRVLEVPFAEKEQLDLVRMNKGVFISFEINKKKPNPYAPSNIMLKFATADSRKVFRVPASKDQYIKSIIANSYGISRYEMEETLANWDKLKSAKSREKRFIVTGNILQGMAKFKGRLIEYTMQDGTVRTGILMPENWVNDDAGKVVIPAEKAYNIIRGLKPMDYVESTSGNIQIQKSYKEGEYYLKVPDSRARGQKYWGDQGLKDLVYDRIFEKRRDYMLGVIPHDNALKDVLKYIQNKYGETFVVQSRNVQKGETSESNAIDILTEFERTTKKVKTHGSTRPEVETQAARSTADMGKRIKAEPIEGGEAKPIWKILKDFSDVIDQKIFWDKSARRSAAGSYTASLGKLVVQKMFKQRLDISTHELGHRLDDMFGLVGPEADPLLHLFKDELRELWQFGSEPPKGASDPAAYRMKEGVAEFFRAYLVNPKETSRRYPEFTRWFEARVKRMSPKVWDAIVVLSDDIRNYLGANGIDRFRSHTKWGLGKEGKLPMGWSTLFKSTTKMGDWVVTKFDVFAQHWLNELNIAERAYRWVLARRGIDVRDVNKVPPSENFITLAHLLNGSMDKIGDMMMYGVTDAKLNRQIDPITKRPISFPWQYEAIPSASLPEMREFMEKAGAVNMAQRVLEVIWKLGGKQVRKDLAASDYKIPSLEILKKYPHIASKYMSKIQAVIDLINKGDLLPGDAIYPDDRYDHDRDVIVGIAQEGETDKQIAEKALEEYEEIKTNDPLKAKQMEEFNRRYLLNVMQYIKYAWEKGLMSDDLYELISQEDLHYIAFHRFFREHGPDTESWNIKGFNDLVSEMKDSRGFEGRLHIHAITGSPHPIKDPYLIQIEAAHSLVLNADKNEVLRAFVLAFTGDREFYDEDRVQIADIGYITKTPGQSGTSLQFFLRGKPLYFTVQDPYVYQALKGLAQSPMLPKWATFFPQMLRTMVTHSIPFAIRNPIRDLFTRMIIGKEKSIPNIKRAIKGYDEKIKHMYDLAGGGQFGFYIKNRVDYYRLQREWMFQHSKDPNKYFMDFKTFVNLSWDKIDTFFSKSEKINRLGLAKATYDKAIKNGMDPYEALLLSAYEARDFLDFHVAGTYMKSLNQFVVFSNAAIRGMAKMIKTAKERPGDFFAWWAIVALAPSLANSMMIAAMDDDTIEEYKQLPAYQRDMYFNIPLGGGRWLSIPKPFELGYMASSVQRILDRFILDDERAFDEDWYRLGYKAFFPFDFAGLTGGFAGILHVATKRDFFRDKWIIPPSEMDVDVALRNTETATRIGKAFQALSGADPRLVDDFIMAQFPYYGEYFLKGSEMVLGGAKKREMQFDIYDLGVFRQSPVYAARDVQWVLQTAKKYKLNNHPYMDLLNAAIKVYYSEDVQKDRTQMLKVGQDIRKTATLIRNEWDIPGVDFAEIYKQAQEIKKLQQ